MGGGGQGRLPQHFTWPEKCQEKSKLRSHIGNTNLHFANIIISVTSIPTQFLSF